MNATRLLSIGAAALAVCAAKAATVDADVMYGEALKLGNGVARIYADLDADGAPARSA